MEFKEIKAKVCSNPKCKNVIPEYHNSSFGIEWCPNCGNGIEKLPKTQDEKPNNLTKSNTGEMEFKEIKAKVCPNVECKNVIPDYYGFCFKDNWCPECKYGVTEEKMNKAAKELEEIEKSKSLS
ncbi:hypothetical protein AAGG74_15415 [Bacillus mexicanus]|uniref:hypothetical protein n=1 Tax=Bacillus mexicanus TaxID=2834415 RepID=UPI003D1D3EDF